MITKTKNLNTINIVVLSILILMLLINMRSCSKMTTILNNISVGSKDKVIELQQEIITLKDSITTLNQYHIKDIKSLIEVKDSLTEKTNDNILKLTRAVNEINKK